MKTPVADADGTAGVEPGETAADALVLDRVSRRRGSRATLPRRGAAGAAREETRAEGASAAGRASGADPSIVGVGRGGLPRGARRSVRKAPIDVASEPTFFPRDKTVSRDVATRRAIEIGFAIASRDSHIERSNRTARVTSPDTRLIA